jgi:hypothetical protein
VVTAVGDEVSYATVISDEVVKASEICTVRRDCKSMVVAFLLPFWQVLSFLAKCL